MALNPGAETFNVTLQRENPSQSWGFRLQGGKDFNTPLSVSMVNPGCIAEQYGVKVGDAVLQINGVNTDELEHEQAKYEILKCGNQVNFLLQRGQVKVWRPQVTNLADLRQGGQPTQLPEGYDSSFVQKTSLAANKSDALRIGSAHNRSARPFPGFGGGAPAAPQPAQPPQQSYSPQPQQYGQPEQSYNPQPQQFAQPQQSYSPQPQQYGQPQQSYNPQPQQYGQPQQSYSPQPPQQQFGQPPQQYGQPQQQYGQAQPQYNAPQEYGQTQQYGPPQPSQLYGQPGGQPQYTDIDDGIGGKGLVHAQYNSPMGIYSNENIMDTFQAHASVLAQDLNKVNVNDDAEVSKITNGQQPIRPPRHSKPAKPPKPAALQKSTITVPPLQSKITVVSANSSGQSPSEGATIQVSERSTITVPSDRSTIQVPSERSTIQVPSERSTIQVPSERSTIQVPSERSTITVPSQRSTITVSAERSTIKVPSERSTITVPSERSTITVPSRNTIQVKPQAPRQPSPTLLAAIQDEDSKKASDDEYTFKGHSNPHKQSRTFKMLEAGLSGNEDKEVAAQAGVTGFKSVRAPTAKPPSEKQPAQLMTCKACGGLCTGVFVRIRGDPMHPECFKCVKCGVHLKNIGYFVVEGKLYCDVHAKQVAQPPAPGMVAVPTFQ